jgi:pseudaminic acid cytidylyltransferase
LTICVIPARGGSKRIPRKNIKDFHGKPMIAWSIEAAQKASIFSKIIVSTDDNEIADIAKKMGAEVPFVRPRGLSDDYATTGDVMSHACKWMTDNGIKPTVVCCLYPTAPFVEASDLIEGLRLMSSGNWKYVFSVGEYSSPVFRSFEQDATCGVKMLFPEYFETRSQDLPNVYHDAGMFYMGSLNTWIRGVKIFDKHSFPLKIPQWRVQDIDTPDDWDRAEILAASILNIK